MLTASMLVAHLEFDPSRQREAAGCRQWGPMGAVYALGPPPGEWLQQMNIPARICKERGASLAGLVCVSRIERASDFAKERDLLYAMYGYDNK